MRAIGKITSPSDRALDRLCHELSEQASALDAEGEENWPKAQLALCAEYGVFGWFLPREWGGQDWSEPDTLRAYLRLSAACLTTTFVLTQLTGAARRIAASVGHPLKARLLPDLASGARSATLGISHLTTSRRHLSQPAVRARRIDGGFELEGCIPWVTGACCADYVVTGAQLDDGQQVVVTLPLDDAGVSVSESVRLLGLSAAQTGQVHLKQVNVSNDGLIDGPAKSVLREGLAARTGGLQTSALALGVAIAAVDYLRFQGEARPNLSEPAVMLRKELDVAQSDLLETAAGTKACSREQLRVRANDLVLRSSQAALAAAKGTGYVRGHRAERWCREALFFLVWSCPQAVVDTHVCSLAGIEEHNR